MPIINGTAASETLLGTSGADTIKGLTGNDTITGGEGNDLAQMGAGDDMFIWRAGDGDDRLRGQDGFDTLVFEASGSTDFLSISRDVSHVRVSEAFGNTLDLDDVERIWVRALAGADGIFIDDLAGTDVQQVVVDLAGVPGGKSGDGEVDGVVRNGGGGNDILNVALVNGTVSITGPSAQVMIRNADSDDILEINGLGGNDTINASTMTANAMQLTVDGGVGNDTITGSQGNDELDGGDGNDVIRGGRGNDTVDLGAGNDLFTWSKGDGSDKVQGGDGFDTLLITGSSGANFLDASGGILIGSGASTVDVERIKVRALAGADTIFVGTPAVTDVSAVDIDLAATVLGTLPDAASDTVIVDSYTAGDDVVRVAWSTSKIVVSGLNASLSIAHAGANDLLLFAGNFGNDLYDASSLPAGNISLRFEVDGVDTIFGSAGNDSVLCFPGGEALVVLGAGNDSFQGLDGNDVAHMGAGNDVLTGASGNDIGFLGAGNDRMDGGIGNDLAYLDAGNDLYIWRVGGGNDKVHGAAGIDTLHFYGSAASESTTIDAAGGQVQVTRNVADGTVDLDEFEQIRIHAYGGNDSIGVGDLAGTGIKLVAVDLAGAVASAADGEVDAVYVDGSAGNDLTTVTASKGVVAVYSLATQVTITHLDTNDQLEISGHDGNDTINAGTLPANALELFIFGGNGRDIITGGAGRDNIDGGSGADLLRGGGGADRLYGEQDNDRLEGGAGNDNLNGDSGDDVLLGGLGDDAISGDQGNDTITGGAGNDSIFYSSVLDGHDVILDFDGNPTGGQDTLHLEFLFLDLGVPLQDRAGRVLISDKGATVDVAVDADGNAGNGYELVVATLNTLDVIKLGQDVIIGP